MDTPAKPNKKLLIFSLLIFILEFIGLVGWYWLFDGRAGDATLTISRYVGLNWWSSIVFCLCNLAIASMLIYYLVEHAKQRGFLWRFLMYAFVISFMALSISPHVPDESMPAKIHCFFAGVMFVTMALIGILTFVKSQHIATTIYAIVFTAFSVYFCFSDVLRIPEFMNLIFWFESAYIFAFFGLLILPEKTDV